MAVVGDGKKNFMSLWTIDGFSKAILFTLRLTVCLLVEGVISTKKNDSERFGDYNYKYILFAWMSSHSQSKKFHN